jgi:hypothetical protein
MRPETLHPQHCPCEACPNGYAAGDRFFAMTIGGLAFGCTLVAIAEAARQLLGIAS